MKGDDVKKLQEYLNNNGYIISAIGAGSKGKETTYFGTLTKNAVIKFQKANKITPAIGYFGPITRGVVNKKVARTKVARTVLAMELVVLK